MGIISSIKNKLGKTILERKIKNDGRAKAFINFDSAKSVGIIINASTPNALNITKKFKKELQDKDTNVSCIGYVNTRAELERFKSLDGIELFLISNHNWYYKPNNPIVDEFHTHDIDILIDLSLEDCLPVKYIVGFSKAKLKVGTGSNSQQFYYDFILKVNKDHSLKYYIEQLSHYLSVIKVPKEGN